MSTHMTNPQESFQGLAQGDFSTLDALQSLIADTYEASGLDPQTFMLVRMAALAALDAAPASWLMNIAVGGEAGLAPEQLLGTLICDRTGDRDCAYRLSSRQHPQGVRTRGRTC